MREIERIISLIFRMEAGRRIKTEEGGNFKCFLSENVEVVDMLALLGMISI